MARMRTLKPEFWTDDVIVELSAWARLFYMGCWNFALCDQGHLDDSPKSLKLKILPADPVDAVALVEELIERGRLVRKETPDGRTYLHIRTLANHSKSDTRWNSRCAYCAFEGLSKPVSAPPSPPNHTETQESFEEHTETRSSKGREGKGKEGEGKEDQSTRKRGSRIPEDFTVTGEMVTWAKANAPNVDGRRETEKFMNYWHSKTGSGATKLDWTATWRNWMLTAQTDAERNGSRASPGRQLKDVNGLMLGEANIANLERAERMKRLQEAKDAGQQQLSIEGQAR